MLWTIYKTYWSLPVLLHNLPTPTNNCNQIFNSELNPVSEGQKLKTLGTISETEVLVCNVYHSEICDYIDFKVTRTIQHFATDNFGEPPILISF